jgi:hypothetical protein
MHRFATIATGFALSLAAGAASASQAAASAAVRTDRCAPVPRENFRPEAELKAAVERLGYQVVRVGTDAGCYAVLADDRRGKRFDMRYEGANLRMVSRYLARPEAMSSPTGKRQS